MRNWPKVFSALILIIICGISLAHAQDGFSAGDVGPALPESGSHTLAGALQMAVQPSAGVFRASLPIEVPPARGSSQPSLGIHYSSAAGIRDAGVGWGLEMPVIEQRGPFGGAPDYANVKPGGVFDPLAIRFTFNGEPGGRMIRLTARSKSRRI
jgi:hypothetical protein